MGSVKATKRTIWTNDLDLSDEAIQKWVNQEPELYKGMSLQCDDIHHDGTNHYLFRELVGDEQSCAPLLDAIIKCKIPSPAGFLAVMNAALAEAKKIAEDDCSTGDMIDQAMDVTFGPGKWKILPYHEVFS